MQSGCLLLPNVPDLTGLRLLGVVLWGFFALLALVVCPHAAASDRRLAGRVRASFALSGKRAVEFDLRHSAQ